VVVEDRAMVRRSIRRRNVLVPVAHSLDPTGIVIVGWEGYNV
jgi:hypothetical protein